MISLNHLKTHPHLSISLELSFHRSFPPHLIFICLYIFLFVQILFFPWKLQGGGHSNTIDTYISSHLILAIPPLSKRTWFIFLHTYTLTLKTTAINLSVCLPSFHPYLHSNIFLYEIYVLYNLFIFSVSFKNVGSVWFFFNKFPCALRRNAFNLIKSDIQINT